MPTKDDRFNAATSFNVRVQFADGVELFIRDRADDLGFDDQANTFVSRQQRKGYELSV